MTLIFVRSKGVIYDHVKYTSYFGWQHGYGVFSFGVKDIERAVNYVLNQKQHHENGSTITKFEHFEKEENGP
jgi:putative transposase